VSTVRGLAARSHSEVISLTITSFPVQPVTHLDITFGGDMSKLLPAYADIPDAFKTSGHTKWHDLMDDWFFIGVENLNITPKPGIVVADAIRHIKAIIVSFAPKHEHKTAGAAYLMSLWFEDATWSRCVKDAK
jgi:hypothetical protein